MTQLDYQADTVPVTAAELTMSSDRPLSPHNQRPDGGVPTVRLEMVDASRAASTFASEVRSDPQGAAGLGAGSEFGGGFGVAPSGVGHEAFTTPIRPPGFALSLSDTTRLERPATHQGPPGWLASMPLPGERQ